MGQKLGQQPRNRIKRSEYFKGRL